MNVRQHNTNQIVTFIAAMSRETVTRELMNFPGSFRFDFTREYLDNMSLEQLRHILLAAALHQKKRLS